MTAIVSFGQFRSIGRINIREFIRRLSRSLRDHHISDQFRVSQRNALVVNLRQLDKITLGQRNLIRVGVRSSLSAITTHKPLVRCDPMATGVTPSKITVLNGSKTTGTIANTPVNAVRPDLRSHSISDRSWQIPSGLSE